jgi:signal transduction histidine kinase
VSSNGATIEVRALHRRFVVHEATAVLRHDLRNRHAAVRNATFYVRKRVEKEAAALVEKDARVSKFFDLMGTELDAAEQLLVERLPHLDPPATVMSQVDDAIDVALREAPHVSVQHSGLAALIGTGELAVAVLCLVENAMEAGAATIAVTSFLEGDRLKIEVCDDGPGLPAPADETRPRDGHLGLGLRIVRRIANRASGELVLGSRDGRGVLATLVLPGASS